MFVMFQSRNTPRTVQFTKYHFIQVIWFTSYVEEKLLCQILPFILIFNQDILRNKIWWGLVSTIRQLFRKSIIRLFCPLLMVGIPCLNSLGDKSIACINIKWCFKISWYSRPCSSLQQIFRCHLTPYVAVLTAISAIHN